MLNINVAIEAYTKALSCYADDVVIRYNSTPYEQLELLSKLLLSFKLIDNHINICKLNINSVDFYKHDYSTYDTLGLIENDINTLPIITSSSYTDLYINIIQSIGKLIYFKILETDDSNLNSKLTNLCDKLCNIFLSKDNSVLDMYALISDSSGTLLNYFTKGSELFARAFKDFIIYNSIEDLHEYDSLSFTKENIHEYKNDIAQLLSLVNDNFTGNYLIVDSIKTIELSDTEVENLFLNEERLKAKYSVMLKNETVKCIPILENSLSLLNSPVNCFPKETTAILDVIDSIESIGLTETDTSNFINYKDTVKDLSIPDICEINSILTEEIQELQSSISSIESDIYLYKTEIASGLRNPKDKALKELLKFLFFLSQEHRTKVQMQKSLDSADITYSQEFIDYSENYNINKNILKTISKTDVLAKVNINDIKNSICKIYGLDKSNIKNSILEQNRGSNTIVKFSNRHKKKSKEKDTSNIKEEEQVQVKPTTINSNKAIDSMLKKKVTSIYTNSSSKFKTREYRKLSVTEELKDHKLSNPTIDRLLDDLLNEADNLSKKQNSRSELSEISDDMQF